MMAVLDVLPVVETFFGVDLKTGSMVIAALGIVHPTAYGCTLFVPMSYMLVTMWILVAIYSAASVMLFCGIAKNVVVLCNLWVWYSLVFVCAMQVMMLLLIVVFVLRKQRNRICFVLFGMLWYVLTLYFIVVVNSYRRQLDKSSRDNNEST